MHRSPFLQENPRFTDFSALPFRFHFFYVLIYTKRESPWSIQSLTEDSLLSFAFLNRMSLGNIKRLCIRSLKLLSDLDRNVLIGNNVIQASAGLHDRILHQDTVSDLRAFLDLDASEKNTVLNISLDHTAICNEVIFRLTSGNVSRRVVVTDLCVDRTAGKQRFQILIVKKLHILVKVALQSADPCIISFILVRADVIFLQARCKDITLKIGIAAYKRRMDLLDQSFSFHNIDVHGKILF